LGALDELPPRQCGRVSRSYTLAGGPMQQTLRWIIAASLLVQVAKCDSFPFTEFPASRYAQQSNTLRIQFRTAISPRAPLQTSLFEGNSYGSAGFARPVTPPKSLLLFPPVDSLNYSIGGQSDNGVSAPFWRILKSLIGVSSGPCERAWTHQCEHSFGNPSYRPSSKKK
jgi:hypothetical protein